MGRERAAKPAAGRAGAGLLLLLASAWPLQAQGLEPGDISRLRTVQEVAISPGGERIAYALEIPRSLPEEADGRAWRELWLAKDGAEPRAFVRGQVRVERIAWTPDGEGISFLAERGEDETKSLYRIPVDGGEAEQVVDHGADLKEYAFSPDGVRVAFLAETPEGEERLRLKGMGFRQEVFEEEGSPVLVWIQELSGGAPAQPLELAGSASELHWSPDGKRLALALAPSPLVDDGYMARRIHLVDPTSGLIERRLQNPGKLGTMAWSPDGRHLAYVSAADFNDPKEGRLMLLEVEGGGVRELLPALEGHVVSARWLDEGTLLALADEGVETSLYRVEAESGDAAVIAAAAGPVWEALSVSAGGDRVALRGSTPAHPDELYLLRLEACEPGRLTDSNPWLAERSLARQETVDFRARDGLTLQGVLILPLERREGVTVPLVVIVHGGPEDHVHGGWVTTYSRPGQVLAARGFAVFYPNYRGSTGRGVAFSKLGQGDPAGREFDDLVDAVDHLVGAGLADEAKVGITGGSYGGYATAWASTHYSERFAAGVMSVGISELVSKLGTSDIPRELQAVHARRWPWEDWQLMLERSPLRHVEKARTPLLILGGADDTRVHPSQSLALYRYLKLLDRAPVRYVRYPGEKHGLRAAAARLDFTLRQVRWLEHYLQGPGGAPPPPSLDYGLPQEAVLDEGGS